MYAPPSCSCAILPLDPAWPPAYTSRVVSLARPLVIITAGSSGTRTDAGSGTSTGMDTGSGSGTSISTGIDTGAGSVIGASCTSHAAQASGSVMGTPGGPQPPHPTPPLHLSATYACLVRHISSLRNPGGAGISSLRNPGGAGRAGRGAALNLSPGSGTQPVPVPMHEGPPCHPSGHPPRPRPHLPYCYVLFTSGSTGAWARVCCPGCSGCRAYCLVLFTSGSTGWCVGWGLGCEVHGSTG